MEYRRINKKVKKGKKEKRKSELDIDSSEKIKISSYFMCWKEIQGHFRKLKK